MSQNKRESGFYWIIELNSNQWEVAYYNTNGRWDLVGVPWPYKEEQLKEIDEQRIERK